MVVSYGPDSLVLIDVVRSQRQCKVSSELDVVDPNLRAEVRREGVGGEGRGRKEKIERRRKREGNVRQNKVEIEKVGKVAQERTSHRTEMRRRRRVGDGEEEVMDGHRP